MGMEGICKSQVSRLCAEIDERVQTFLRRPIGGEWPYLWLAATDVRARHGLGAVLVTIGGEVLAMTICNSEPEPFWTEFPRSHTARPARRRTGDLLPMRD